jgi:hypothetical protein
MTSCPRSPDRSTAYQGSKREVVRTGKTALRLVGTLVQQQIRTVARRHVKIFGDQRLDDSPEGTKRIRSSKSFIALLDFDTRFGQRATDKTKKVKGKLFGNRKHHHVWRIR